MASTTNKTLLTVLLWAAVGCSQKVDFAQDTVDAMGSIGKTANPQIAAANFRMAKSESSFDQANYDDNRTSVSFQVITSGDDTFNDLKETDLRVTENAINVGTYKVQSNSSQFVQTVDIVIAMDNTRSMGPTIESAKAKVVEFIRNTRAAGYHTRMCLMTFGDEVRQKCNKFYDNDPKDSSTLTQVEELISEVSKLQTFDNPADKTLDENPLQAVIDAASAPWQPGSQRFMIAITDAAFLYSPSNRGQIGTLAPTYSAALSALAAGQMNLFLVAPNAPGYNTSFSSTQPSLVSASNGEYFKYSDLGTGKITLETVLNRIIQRVRTTYTLNFVVDDIPGLDPTLPLSKRAIKVALIDGTIGTVKVLNISTNLPTGKPEKLSRFKLTDYAIRTDSLKVTVNGEPASGVRLESGTLVFTVAPPMGAKIVAQWENQKIKDALLFQPINLGKEDLNAIMVMMNGKKVGGIDVVFERSTEGNWTMRPSENALSEADPYGIRANGGLNIQVYRIIAEN